MSTTPGCTLAATALTSMLGALPCGAVWNGRRPPPLWPDPVSGFGAGAALSVGRDRWMFIRSMAAQAAVIIEMTRATTSAAVNRLGLRPTGAAGGGGGGAGIVGAGTTHGDGTLHSGGSPRPSASRFKGTARSSSIPSMISGCSPHL